MSFPSCEFLDFLRQGKNFLIAGHKEPDGDCLGSQLVLASALRRIGKETVLCSAGPFKRGETKQYESLFSSAPIKRGDERVILVDCSNLDRTGTLSAHLEGLPGAVIDHHEAGCDAKGSFADGPVFIDKNAPSTTVLVLKLIEALGLEPEREEAELLFFGLCTDTGFFRHVDSNGGAAFEAAAALIRLGANPKAAFMAINGGKTLDSRKLLGHILARSEFFFEGKLILSTEEYEDIRRFGTESRDSDALYQLLLAVAGVEAVALVRQETSGEISQGISQGIPPECSVGLRSREWVDVGGIAASFGGGGHRHAAGCRMAGTIAETKEKVLAAFEKVFA